MRCRPEITLKTDKAYWVPRQIFHEHFDQQDFLCREAVSVQLAYLADWFCTSDDGMLHFYLPTVQFISGKTQFINGRHRTAVLLPFLEKLPIAFALANEAAAKCLERLDLVPLSEPCVLDIPDLPILNRLP